MKKMYVLIFTLTLCLAVIPFFASGAYKTAEKNEIAAAKPCEDDYFMVEQTSGEVTKINGFDYLCSVVAAEMPISYEDEALKAQAVAAYTYACRLRNSSRKNSDSAFDISADSAKNQGFLNEEQMKERWGKSYNRYYSRLKKLVGEVYGEQILYDGEPILAVYHAISSGQTESCAIVWGNELPYLVPADSPYDKSADGYETTCTFTADELKEKILANWGETIFSDSPAAWIGEIRRSDSGTVTQIQIGSAKLTGASVRRCLGLRSACFDAKYTENGFVFTVLGYGHGVGMSQTGANQMAKHGADYREILEHYYSGCQIGNYGTSQTQNRNNC